MDTVGTVLKKARLAKKLSLKQVEKETKIKTSFLKLIEEEKWNELPEYATVLGFVKSIAKTLDKDEEQISALFRRDFPPENLPINPKPDISDKFSWSPKLSFLAGISVIILIIGGYLGFQYSKFVKPPKISVLSPKDGQVVEGATVNVEGKTDPDVVITANNQPIIVGEDGKFTYELKIDKNTTSVKIIGTSRSGRETEVVKNITVPKGE